MNYGYLLGKVNNDIALIKIQINNQNGQNNNAQATLKCNKFMIVSIIDKYLTNYVSVDVDIIKDDKEKFQQNIEINKIVELNNNSYIYYYSNNKRALNDLYIFNNKFTGKCNQYTNTGELITEVKFKKGYIIKCKNYKNGRINEKCKYNKKGEIIYRESINI
jgi:hypothetical protein